MPLFICEKCGSIENTALGFWWSKGEFKFKDSSLNDKALCSACMPTEFEDGEPTGETGEWHGRFPREKYDPIKHKEWNIMNEKKWGVK